MVANSADLAIVQIIRMGIPMKRIILSLVLILATIVSAQAQYIAPYAGAVSRTNNSKMADIVSVFDFIPVNLQAAIKAGTSTTDVSSYLTAMHAAVPADVVFMFPSGQYNIGAGSTALTGRVVNVAGVTFTGGGNLTGVTNTGPTVNGDFTAGGLFFASSVIYNNSGTGSFTIGDPADGFFRLMNAAGTSASYFGVPSSAKFQFGQTDSAAPVAQTFKFQDVVAGTSNTNGVNTTFQASAGTGTGTGGSFIFQTAPGGSTGTAKNAWATALTIDSNKDATFAGKIIGNRIALGATNYDNIIIGSGALNALTGSNGQNVAIGTSALAHFDGTGSTAIGYNAGGQATGNNLTLIGADAGQVITSGSDTVAIGTQVSRMQTTGKANTFIGSRTGYSTVSANYQTDIGYEAGSGTTDGGVAIGAFANTWGGQANNSGLTPGIPAYNTAVGLAANSQSGRWTRNGDPAASRNATFGYASFSENSIGNDNVGVGYGSGYAAGLPIYVYNGSLASTMSIADSQMVLIGSNAARSNSLLRAYFTGTIDNGAGGAGTTLTVSAGSNLAVGQAIMKSHDSSVGSEAPEILSGTVITGLGTGTGGVGTYIVNNSQLVTSTLLTGETALTNAIGIGYNVVVSASNSVVLGNSSITSTTLRGAVTGPTSINTSGMLLSGATIYSNGGTGSIGIGNTDGFFKISNNAATAASYFGTPANANFQFGSTDAAAPVAQTIKVQDVIAGTSNVAGVNTIIQASAGTGTGTGGSLLFQTAPAGSTGTAKNAWVTALTINGAGNATFAGGLTVTSTITSNSSGIAILAGSGQVKGAGIVSTDKYYFNASTQIATNGNGGIAIQTSGSANLITTDTSGNMTINGTLTASGIASDATHTDSTVCQDTTTHVFYAGSGALGVCLGTSGRQFKTAFAPMSVGIDELMKIDFVNYFYKDGYGDNGARMQYGTTAQDVEAAIPDIARQDAKGETINYDSGALLFIGLRAIQQLKADNDNIRNELRSLKTGTR